jgi:hypothetical protein
MSSLETHVSCLFISPLTITVTAEIFLGPCSLRYSSDLAASVRDVEAAMTVLQVACELELWQEAFRSVEDIQNLFVLGKRPGKPQMMAIFYARLTKIFTVSEYHLQNGWPSHST